MNALTPFQFGSSLFSLLIKKASLNFNDLVYLVKQYRGFWKNFLGIWKIIKSSLSSDCWDNKKWEVLIIVVIKKPNK